MTNFLVRLAINSLGSLKPKLSWQAIIIWKFLVLNSFEKNLFITNDLISGLVIGKKLLWPQCGIR